MLTFMLLSSSVAMASKTADFDCCHTAAKEAKAPSPLRIVVVPPADVRPPVAENPAKADHYAYYTGVVRTGVGIPYGLYTPYSARDLVAEALADDLRALGHEVTVSSDAPKVGQPAWNAPMLTTAGGSADLVLHGTLSDWAVDISAAGTHKFTLDLELVALDPESKAEVARVPLAYSNHDTTDRSIWVYQRGAKKQAKEWYGKRGGRWIWAAIVEQNLINTAALATTQDSALRKVVGPAD